MAITISVAEVKRKAGIAESVTTHDSAISALITEMQNPLEYSLADKYLSDTTNTKLQATLKLGLLEMITGEFLEQLRREIGSTEEFSIAGLSIGESAQRGVDLIQQGATRISPYLKSALPMVSESVCTSSSSDDEKTFSRNEGVW